MLDARYLEPQDLAVIDVSFISLWLILPALIDVVGMKSTIQGEKGNVEAFLHLQQP